MTARVHIAEGYTADGRVYLRCRPRSPVKAAQAVGRARPARWSEVTCAHCRARSRPPTPGDAVIPVSDPAAMRKARNHAAWLRETEARRLRETEARRLARVDTIAPPMLDARTTYQVGAFLHWTVVALHRLNEPDAYFRARLAAAVAMSVLEHGADEPGASFTDLPVPP